MCKATIHSTSKEVGRALVVMGKWISQQWVHWSRSNDWYCQGTLALIAISCVSCMITLNKGVHGGPGAEVQLAVWHEDRW
jgi:hypothetical protein